MVQDRIFAFGAVLLAAALIPAITHSIHAPVWSAALTAAVLVMFAFTYRSLNMRWAFATVGIQAILWIVVLVQSIR